MLARSLLRAVVLSSVVLAGLAGCGSQVTGSAASGTPHAGPASPATSVNPGGPDIPAPSGATPVRSMPSAACGGARLQPAPAGTAVLTLRNASNGGAFCVPAGERVDVYLTSTPGQMWAPIQSDSRSLVPLTHGHLMLPVGATGAFFAALHQGIAHLSSARQVCAAKPIRCDTSIAFRATVIVTGHT